MYSIDSVREQIDQLDEQLVKLIELRAELVHKLITHKKEQGMSARQPEREKAIISALYQKHGNHFTFEELEEIYRPIFDACVRMQLTD
ncbi:chorismate mutase [Kangiella sediminilitoris]|uniref:chorismate mutase n=1 Tax=Kangiella sediminilitoris TaxID=1144748 RepID=A0A1B3BAX7_9GAMM|nr:chorismate mutase [Kangiella sediminilitoris]AOE49949.1 Chorismate mutase [Kangiella sediminilitoris]